MTKLLEAIRAHRARTRFIRQQLERLDSTRLSNLDLADILR